MSKSQLVKLALQLTPSQVFVLTALPHEDAFNFIAEKAAEGNPVEDMTKRQFQDEVNLYKEKALKSEQAADQWKAVAEEKDKEVEKKAAEVDRLYKENNILYRENRSFKSDKDELNQRINLLRYDLNSAKSEVKKQKKEIKNLEDKLQNSSNSTVTASELPKDYMSMKNRITELEADNMSLKHKLTEIQTNTIIENVIPLDYEENKKALAKLQSQQETFRVDLAISQKLTDLFMAANFLFENKDRLPENIQSYFESDPLTFERIKQVINLANFLKKIKKN